ncbi:unnamed protein product [Prunus armeniaca]|uniref:Uncharacterized protein n=1 Tax=Prunus armeniaca TaxID=36596 RepID=A0A6J5WHH6_PRUAR|nr:unnamed protein product [Prunus armeniaca]
MKSSGAFGFEAVVVQSIISSFAILVHYTCIVTAFSSSFTCFWVWIGFSLALPEVAFAMIILDATSSFKWLATTAPTVSSLGLLPMAMTQRVTFGRLWRGADAVSIEGIASCSFADKATKTILEGSP